MLCSLEFSIELKSINVYALHYRTMFIYIHSTIIVTHSSTNQIYEYQQKTTEANNILYTT
jgi:hypothetical protein